MRKRCFMAATISFNNGATTCDCVVRNLSENGARIDLGVFASVPMYFELHIPLRQQRFKAELKWRSETEAGVQFLQEDGVEAVTGGSEQKATAALQLRIRELEAEVVRLQNRFMQLTEG